MKASEIFLEFAAPLHASASANIGREELQKILSVPELVWNSVVLDRNPKRRKGDMPKRLRDHLQTMGTRHRKIFRQLLKFWVLRKDQIFAECNWPINVTVYENVKGALIVRCEVHDNKKGNAKVPAEWLRQKPLAPIVTLHPTKI